MILVDELFKVHQHHEDELEMWISFEDAVKIAEMYSKYHAGLAFDAGEKHELLPARYPNKEQYLSNTFK